MNEPIFKNWSNVQFTLFELLTLHSDNVDLCRELMYAQVGQSIQYAGLTRIK